MEARGKKKKQKEEGSKRKEEGEEGMGKKGKEEGRRKQKKKEEEEGRRKKKKKEEGRGSGASNIKWGSWMTFSIMENLSGLCGNIFNHRSGVHFQSPVQSPSGD